ncbi:gp436 family protein [Endozoicomonas atrinae]|uniref:gp436 family protein n=1 Tax=Endozoicomonas atrinae TaxID=1333660 RepID=UPI003B005909
MKYCDSAAMIARFGEDEVIRLTDPGDGAMDAAAIDAALTDASDEIDSYLAVRYTLPLSVIPEIVVRLCADIARYRLYDGRMLDEVEKRYDDSVKLLKDIVRGSAVLPLPSTTASTEVSTTRSRDDRLFTRDTLEDF